MNSFSLSCSKMFGVSDTSKAGGRGGKKNGEGERREREKGGRKEGEGERREEGGRGRKGKKEEWRERKERSAYVEREERGRGG